MKAGPGKRILLTGGTGFIGANLAHRLVSQGHYVAVVTRECSNRARLQQLAGKIHFLTADLLEAKGLQQAVSTVDPEVVYHLASTPFNPPTITAQTHMQVIALGTLNLLVASSWAWAAADSCCSLWRWSIAMLYGRRWMT